MKLIFLQTDKHESFLKVSKMANLQCLPTRWFYDWSCTWSNILKLLKVLSLQYFYNSSKKNLGMEFVFCMQMSIKVPASWYCRFWEKWSNMSKVPKVLLLWCKAFRLFTGVQSCSLLLVFFKLLLGCPRWPLL